MIAIDWGTSRLRAYRLGDQGQILESRSAPQGVLHCQGRFEEVLAMHIQGWDDTRIVMAGMVGSGSGWMEVPYVACPAGLHEIADRLQRVAAPSLPDRELFIVPGLSQQAAVHHPDVMRGEEVQLLGLAHELADKGTHCVCLPGTHSKWARLHHGRVVSIRTAMTGELYWLLRKTSLLATLMPPATTMGPPGDADDIDDADAFIRGVADSRRDGGLAHHLFAVRTQGLFGMLPATHAPSYLSGLLIGHELLGLLPRERPVVHLVGDPRLLARYEHALSSMGVRSARHTPDLGAQGSYRLAAALP